MVLRDTWSRRKRLQEQQGAGDVFTYDDLPQPLRVQIFNLLRHTIGGYAEPEPYSFANPPPSNQCWGQLEHMLADDFGLFGLGQHPNPIQNFTEFFMRCQNIDQLLDCVELTFRAVDRIVRGWMPDEQRRSGADTHPDDAIARLNARFLEHQVGYQYESGRIIKIDNQMVHAEVVTPALQLLSDPLFAGPNQEFLTALGHLRHGRTKEAIVEAAKSFESTIKTICDLRGWSYLPTDTASRLIDVLFSNGLIPTHLQSQFTALKSVLESGAPTIRNRTPAHGQGAVPTVVPQHLARFAINTVAANIVLLVEAHHGSP